MNLFSRLVTSLLAALPLTLAAQAAFAQESPCGKFDFSDGSFNCKIEVEGGCSAQCTPLKFEAGCSGGCTATASQSCVDSCGEACILECDPALLDCFQGCHDECDEPTKQRCLQDHPDEDCVAMATAQCDIHCKDSCEVPPSTCEEHCNSCCTGGCVTQTNYDCDYQCFAKLQGGCDVQCSEPEGALFCNGQYVFAEDIEACITYLAEQGIEVDVSARGEVECDLSGCEGDGTSNLKGLCAVSNVGLGAGAGGLAFAAAGLALATAMRRRKNGKR